MLRDDEDIVELLNPDVDITPPHHYITPIHPRDLKQDRIDTWPTAGPELAPTDIGAIYEKVKETGVPNAMGAKIPIKTGLNVDAWKKYLVEDDDLELLSFITYGFPASYQGPASNQVDIKNHPSAEQYPSQVTEYIEKGLKNNHLLGPFSEPPFQGWNHM